MKFKKTYSISGINPGWDGVQRDYQEETYFSKKEAIQRKEHLKSCGFVRVYIKQFKKAK